MARINNACLQEEQFLASSSVLSKVAAVAPNQAHDKLLSSATDKKDPQQARTAAQEIVAPSPEDLPNAVKASLLQVSLGES